MSYSGIEPGQKNIQQVENEPWQYCLMNMTEEIDPSKWETWQLTYAL